tara:strand:- start:247 stop:492 length:246 start_codon:yes stop_codon:yes gene_type:complete
MDRDFSTYIRAARRRKGWSQLRLGREAELDDSMISRVELGNREPTVAEFTRIEMALRGTFRIFIEKSLRNPQKRHRACARV